MSEFERLTDDRDADPDLARLFRAGRAPAPLSPKTFERSRRRVLGLMAAPAGLGVLGWVQHAALGAVLGTGVAVVAALPRLLSPPAELPRVPPSRAAQVTLQSAAPVRPTPSAAPSVTPALAVSSTASATAAFPVTAAEPAAENPLLRETRLLESARAELERKPAASLRLLAEHEREFSNGALGLERDFLTVAALARLGERARAEARAAALRARAPGSLYEQRLERVLAGGGAGP